MLDATDWLPLGAFSEARIRACTAATIEEWSQAWFARHAASIVRARLRDNDVIPRAQTVVMGAYRARLGDIGVRAIAEAAIDMDLPKKVAPGDQPVIELLVEHCIRDLLARLERWFGAATAGNGAQAELAIALDGAECVTAAIPAHMLVPGLKRQMKSPQPRPLGGFRDALAPTKVPVEAVLGSAQVSIGDVRAMAPGDVLIIDRDVNDGVDLRIAVNCKPVATGRLSSDGSRVLVEL